MFNTKSKFHKGSSVLVSALVTAAASTLIGYGLTKMISTGIDAIKNQEVKMQGQQYAASRINVLRSVRFDSLSPMAKRQINDTDYYEEVVESDSTADRKNYAVNIYKGSDSVKPVAVMNLSRTATGALLDNQGADSYDSLGAGGNADSSALNTSALKNYTNDKFSADSESFATDRAMDVKSFVSYVDGMLSKYRFRNNAVIVGPNGAGSRRNPIYVTAAERECTAGSVTYAMSGNSQGYLATVTPAGNGLYYVDYTDKDVPDAGEVKPPVKPPEPPVSPSKPSDPPGKFDGCRWTYETEGWDHKVTANTFDKTEEDSNGRLWHVFKTCSNTKYLVIIVAGDSGTYENPCTTDLLLKDSINNELEMPNGISWFSLGNIADSRIVVEVTPDSYYKVWGDVFDDYNEGYESLAINIIELDPSQTKVDIENGKAYNDSILSPGLGKYSFVHFYSF